MNKQQVNIIGFIHDVRTYVSKLDKQASVVMTDISNHYAENHGYKNDSYEVRVTVFHKDNIVYAYTYGGLPTMKQFKQLAQAEYRKWLKKNSIAL